MLLLIVTALMEMNKKKKIHNLITLVYYVYLQPLCVHIHSYDYNTIKFVFFLFYLFHYKVLFFVLFNVIIFIQIHLFS